MPLYNETATLMSSPLQHTFPLPSPMELPPPAGCPANTLPSFPLYELLFKKLR